MVKAQLAKVEAQLCGGVGPGSSGGGPRSAYLTVHQAAMQQSVPLSTTSGPHDTLLPVLRALIERMGGSDLDEDCSPW